MAIKLGLLGFGTVASGIPFLLEQNHEKITAQAKGSIEIAKVLVRTEADKERLSEEYPYEFVTDIEAILTDPSIAIVVELIGRIEPAKTYIMRAFEAGKHVVSANKDLIASHGKELISLAKAHHVAFYYEAAVAGGIPILRTLANSLTSDQITSVLGVLNGTSNFMLTKMVDEGWSYEAALAKAQELGYAESNPTNDVEGIDAAYKAVILSQFGFGMTIQLEDVQHKGITTITKDDVAGAQQLGYVIKLIGAIEETPSGLYAEVSPSFVPKSHPLASVNDVMNAVYVESIGIGKSMFYGPGAGQKPTATSVVADIIRISQLQSTEMVKDPFNAYNRDTRLADPSDVMRSYYFAIETPNRQGQLLKLADIFNAENISFEQVLQQKANGKTARVVMITHEMSKTALANVTAKLAAVKEFTILNTFNVLGG